MTLRPRSSPIALPAGKRLGRSTTASPDSRRTVVVLMRRYGPSKVIHPDGGTWGSTTFWSTNDRYWRLLAETRAFIEMYSVVDFVMTQNDAFSPEHLRMGFGRIYEAWKRVRSALDQEYNQSEDRRGASLEVGGGVRRANRPVLQPRRRRSNGGRSFGP